MLTAQQIHEKSFSRDKKGYNIDEVDIFLDEVIVDLSLIHIYSEAMVDPALYAKHVQAEAIHPFFPTCFAPGVIELSLIHI